MHAEILRAKRIQEQTGWHEKAEGGRRRAALAGLADRFQITCAAGTTEHAPTFLTYPKSHTPSTPLQARDPVPRAPLTKPQAQTGALASAPVRRPPPWRLRLPHLPGQPGCKTRHLVMHLHLCGVLTGSTLPTSGSESWWHRRPVLPQLTSQGRMCNAPSCLPSRA